MRSVVPISMTPLPGLYYADAMHTSWLYPAMPAYQRCRPRAPEAYSSLERFNLARTFNA